jgi:hypothetical protein
MHSLNKEKEISNIKRTERDNQLDKEQIKDSNKDNKLLKVMDH